MAHSLGISAGAVGAVLARAEAAGVSWEQVEQLGELELEKRLYGPAPQPAGTRPLPDPSYIHTERKKPGVTLELLHQEYLEKYPPVSG